MDIDTRLLRYFAAVAEELSFSRAAERLHISQPPLSYAIKQLEENLGAPLLVRTSRHVQLTPAGHALHKEARFLLQRNADVRQLVQRIQAGLQGQIRIGFVGSMLYRGLPTLLQQCKQRYPQVERALQELNSAEQIDLVANGGLDIGLIHANPVPDHVHAETLLSEPLVLCLPAGHALAGKKKAPLKALSQDDFIFFSRSFSPTYYETLLALCLDAGFMPKIHYEARHWLSVASLVSQNLGVSIVPRSLANCGLTGLSFVDFAHAQRSSTQLIWSAKASSQIVENHLLLIRQWFDFQGKR